MSSVLYIGGMKNRVRELREAKGLTQKELGQALRRPVSRQTINSLEKGVYDPGGYLLLDIAHFFQTPAEEIFDASLDD